MWRRIFIILIFFIIVFGVRINPVFGYLDGTLIRADGYEKVYVLENGLRRWITNPDVFNRLGYKWSNVRVINKASVDKYALSNDLNNSYYYPDGSLIRGEGPEVYLIEAGKKRWIPNPEIFTAKGFQWKKILRVREYTINSLKQGADIGLEKESLRPITWLLEGPCKPHQNEIPTINSTEVVFKFSGDNPTGPDKELTFETYLQGYDQRWQPSYSYERKINLKEGSKTYTFYIRAKNRDGYYDSSPVFCSFKTKISAYKDKINLYGVSYWSTDPKYESISINTSYFLEGSVNITDWMIKTSRATIIIPQAVKMFHPESMYNLKEDIYLNRNERITIYGGPSPVSENAFAVNKCWWYVDDVQKYKDCYYDYNQDADFLTGEYRFYLNRTTELFDNRDETITLQDKDKLIIDTYEY